MDDRPAWTPGELPESAQPAEPTWNAPSGAPYGGSSYPGSPDAQGYPPPGVPPYSPPPASPYAPPATGAVGGTNRFGTPTAQPTPYGTPAQGSYGQFGAPSPAGYPPPGQAYGYAGPQPMAPYGGAPLPPYLPPNPRTDGFAIAALGFGILGGWLSFVFGAIALSRIKKSGARGRGMAIAGMVTGGAILLLEIGLAVALPVFLNQRTHALHTSCANGDMAACDTLFNRTPDGTSEHAFADTCGGRTDGGYLCTSVGAVSYGDDKHLDALWDACKAGDMASCDELYYSSEAGSDYSQYGLTCGGRTDGSADCVDALGDQTSST